MPTLHWVGKEAVLNHHEEVPFHLLECDPALSVGDADSGNLLIEGDNLLALKALLPYYAGKVKCIYIDPPYNTGEESWVYNDNANNPEIKKWLGEVVGKEMDDLSRHDKWLCMIYPRLVLLSKFLAKDGLIFVSIDDNEVASLRKLLDTIFGSECFVAQIVWQKRTSPESRLLLGAAHDYIVCYGANRLAKKAGLRKIPLLGSRLKDYKNPDNDPRGKWASTDLTGQTGHATNDQFYNIEAPNGKIYPPPPGRCWAVAKSTFYELVKDNRIWFGVDGNARPRRKVFLGESEGMTTWTWWPNNEVGHNQEATKEVNEILGNSDLFETPKPSRLLKRLIQLSTDSDSLILDSFAGSGTTGHAIMQANEEDDGTRRFILVEMEKEVARSVTKERLQRVIDGYEFKGTERIELLREKLTVTNFKKSAKIVAQMEALKQEHADEFDGFETKIANDHITFNGKRKIDGFKTGLGGGFRYCRLGETLFDAEGDIRQTVTFAELARHVFFSETGSPLVLWFL